MEKKNIILIAVVIIAIVAVAAAIFSTNFTGGSGKSIIGESTQFKVEQCACGLYYFWVTK